MTADAKARHQAARAIFLKFDTDNSGELDDTELRNMLTHANEGVPVSEDVVLWCRGVADASDLANKHSGVGLRGALIAVDAFYAFKQNEAEINDLFDKYDTNRSGRLESQQLNQVIFGRCV